MPTAPTPDRPSGARPRGLLALLAATALFTGCVSTGRIEVEEASRIPSEGGAPGTDPASAPGAEGDTAVTGDLDWAPCEDQNPVVATECATLSVPLDHAEPDGARIELALARTTTSSRAERIGSLVLNPGGPGGSGVEFLAQAAAIIPPTVAERFDLVGFDPRGVGASTAVTCEIDLDDEIVLIADGDVTAFERLVDDTRSEREACTAASLELAPHVGTNNAARDLDLVRAALGDDRLTFLGYSYGTRLGATYAELFPDRVRAMVLDAGVRPIADEVELTLDQAAGFDRSLTSFAAACDADDDCLLGELGGALAVLDGLRDELGDEGSLPTDDPDRVLTRGELDVAVIAALYSRETWPILDQALYVAEVSQDGTILQVLADAQLGRELDGTYSNLTVANAFINCADQSERLETDELYTDAERVAAASEFFDGLFRAAPGCVGVPASADPLVIGPADGTPPLLVLGNTGDPATPYDWSVELAASLSNAVLYTVEAEGHTAYGTIACVADVVDAYLVDLVVPDAGGTCADVGVQDPFVPIEETPVGTLVRLFDCLRDNGVEIGDVTVADVLADPTGEVLGAELDPTDPAFAEAAFACAELLLELQGEL